MDDYRSHTGDVLDTSSDIKLVDAGGFIVLFHTERNTGYEGSNWGRNYKMKKKNLAGNILNLVEFT